MQGKARAPDLTSQFMVFGSSMMFKSREGRNLVEKHTEEGNSGLRFQTRTHHRSSYVLLDSRCFERSWNLKLIVDVHIKIIISPTESKHSIFIFKKMILLK